MARRANQVKDILHDARRVERRNALLGPRSFMLSGRRSYVIYAIAIRQHPGAVKVGQTSRWAARRHEYAQWDLSEDDAITAERVFTITEEFVDLARLEAAILAGLPFPIYRRREWFRADLDDVARWIDQFLCEVGLSYV